MRTPPLDVTLYREGDMREGFSGPLCPNRSSTEIIATAPKSTKR
jgi:hypothetical protein